MRYFSYKNLYLPGEVIRRIDMIMNFVIKTLIQASLSSIVYYILKMVLLSKQKV